MEGEGRDTGTAYITKAAKGGKLGRGKLAWSLFAAPRPGELARERHRTRSQGPESEAANGIGDEPATRAD
jgi:hypothetical protein